MEGLEVSILSTKDVYDDNANKRIDSDYFKKEYISFFKKVPDLKPLSSFVKEGYRVVYENTKIIDKTEGKENNNPYFLQAADLKTPFINRENLFYVAEEDWKRYKKGRIKHGELLIEVKGKVDKVSIVPPDFPTKTLVTGSLFKLQTNEKIDKHLLLSYLISKYGKSFKNRFKTNLLISYLSKPDLYRIPIPNFSSSINSYYNNIFSKLFELQVRGKNEYSQAKELLIKNVGLSKFKPSENTSNIKSLSDSFLSSGRLDAEYYDPTTQRLLEIVKKGKTIRLGDISLLSNGFPWNSKKFLEGTDGEGVIRIRHVKPPFIDPDTLSKLDTKYCDSVEVSKAKKNSIVIGMDGLKYFYASQMLNTAYVNQRVANLEIIDQIPVEYITLVINSIIGQTQLLRNMTIAQTVGHINNETIKNLIIPVLNENIINEITNMVRHSIDCIIKSKRLLHIAKLGVEKVIEENEEKATQWIISQLKTHEINLKD